MKTFQEYLEAVSSFSKYSNSQLYDVYKKSKFGNERKLALKELQERAQKKYPNKTFVTIKELFQILDLEEPEVK